MIKIKNNKSNKTIISLIITMILASMLILSQTAAVSVTLTPSKQECNVGDVIDINAKVEILSSKGEWANIKNITLKVEKDGKVDTVQIPLTLEPGKTVLSNKPLSNTSSEVIEVKLLSTNAVYGYGYGYSYVNDSGYGYLNWHYGYGYGYGYSGYGYNVLNSPSNAIIEYNIKWKPSETGTYKFTLEVTLEDGTKFGSECTVNVNPTTSVTSGGGGGKRTTTSEEGAKSLLEAVPEKYIVKEITVTPGKEVAIAIDKELSDLIGLDKLMITLDKSMNLQVIVSAVKSLPTTVNAPPSGEPFSIFEIVFVNKDAGELVEPKGEVEFKVPKSWLMEKGYGKENVVLERWNGNKWEDISTEVVGEDGEYIKYRAKLNSFCILAICAKEIAVENITNVTVTKNVTTKDVTVNKTKNVTENITAKNVTKVTGNVSKAEEEKKSNIGLVVGIIIILAILGALAYFLTRKK
ncbi:PGF-pre-PGF domain-containing protein [Methanotorris igneus]|uniref:PGF-pre-PGF domain-containing protein n=1 Tax=Methanotorris igneus (strain DSM 5666 / JCM 11834 / Kol 5) TaxID=880724 RepID=F6BBD2_METIK|nr:PGF-pre-PGF domain-containing protein [Methanotorris igneus]AEF97139.1 hypothetical protein Metig_1606 [Methanotorris igneus Kol 5]